MDRIQESFNRQGFMKTLGATLETVEKGKIVLKCTYQDILTQQHGYIHGGVLTSLADVACGYAAMTVARADKDILTVEFKINFLRPGNAKQVIAIGEVIQSGKTLTVCSGTVYDEASNKILAKMTATMMQVQNQKIE